MSSIARGTIGPIASIYRYEPVSAQISKAMIWSSLL